VDKMKWYVERWYMGKWKGRDPARWVSEGAADSVFKRGIIEAGRRKVRVGRETG
jgi:hypothetical protein